MPLASTFGLTLLAAATQSASQSTEQIDQIVSDFLKKSNTPAVSIAVVRNGRVEIAKGYGLANIELRTPATAETVYRIGSLTKQFTATIIMRLVEEGKLSLDDSVSKHLSELPGEWKDVKIRHLLNHTSGIPSYTSMEEMWQRVREDTAPADIVKMSASHPLEFKPGEKWDYNNTGYVMLGMIIEEVEGKPYADVLRARITAPLGMNATTIGDHRTIIPNRAAGYRAMGGKVTNAPYMSMTWPYSAGAIVSNVVDLAKWDAAQDSERLLKKDSLAQMLASTKLLDGTVIPYGLGWATGSVKGHSAIMHGGGIYGFSSYHVRYPSDNLSVIVLANNEEADGGPLARAIAGVYVADLKPDDIKPIEDKDPATTAKIKQVLGDLLQGKVDRSQLTDEFNKILTDDLIKSSSEQMRSLGIVEALHLLRSADVGGTKVMEYHVQLTNGTAKLTASVAKDGKISGLLLQPG